MAKDDYNNLVSENPDRDDEISEEEIENAPASSYQQENLSSKDSDLLITLKMLFPTFTDPEIQNISQVIMLGRVFPETFNLKVQNIVVALALTHWNDPKFNVIFTIMTIEGLCQIGLQGKGRVEAVIVSGNTKEVAEQDARGMG